MAELLRAVLTKPQPPHASRDPRHVASPMHHPTDIITDIIIAAKSGVPEKLF